MALGVVRMKRKAYEEPAEALVIALKKSKKDEEQCEIHLKFATTLPKEANFLSGQIQDAIQQDKLQKDHLRQSPKHVSFPSAGKRVQYFKAEQKMKREQAIAGRRLILTQSSNQEDNLNSSDISESENNHCFVLYDIIEENEDPKATQADVKIESSEGSSSICCNGVPLVRVAKDSKLGDYVYDVYYITKGNLDDQFIEGSLSIEPCDPVEEELGHPEEFDEPEVCYDDEDDSNDEDNWRNDYPDEDSDFEKEKDYYGDYELDDPDYAIIQSFKRFNLDEDKEGNAYATYKAKILQEITDEDDDFDTW